MSTTSDHPFVVVDFFKEKKVAAVPTKWITKKGQDIFCFWPTGPGGSDLQKDPTSIPQRNWSAYPVKVIKYSGEC